MAIRTTAAQTLDTSIATLLTDLDAYLNLAGQAGEPTNAVGDYFWSTLISKLVTRARMRPLILSNPRDIGGYSVAATVNTVEARDPKA